MKAKLFIIILLGLSNILLAQNLYTTSAVIPNTGNKLSEVQFVDANTGFATVYRDTQLQVAKTTNKGINWSFTPLPSGNSYTTASMQFVNKDTGFAYYKNYIARTTNGGINWNLFPNLTLYSDNSYNNIIKFSSSHPNIGYYTIRNETNSTELKIMKTIDGGHNWSQIFTQSSALYTYFIKDIAFDEEYPDLVAFAGWSYNLNGGTISYANYCLFVTTNGGTDFIRTEDSHASNSAFTSVQIIKKSDNSREFRMITNKIYQNTEDVNSIVAETGFTSYNESGLTYRKIDNLANGNTVYTGNGLKFINENTGYILSQSKIYRTTNSGVNWNLDYNIGSADPTFSHRLSIIGNVLYAAEPSGTLAIRKLNSNLATFKDNVSINSTFGIQDIPGASGYNTYNTPTSVFLLGGDISMTTNYFINQNQSNEAIFYKWSTGESSTNTYSYLASDGNFSANYKTKNLSTDFSSISRTASSKSLKDVNGNINRIHTSIGGIFFSRSTDNGATFSHEEVVNTNTDAATNNINPQITEIKSPTTPVPVLKNVAATWERRDGNNINILYAYRATVDNVNSYWVTSPFQSQFADGYSFTVSGATDQNFQCQPKIFTVRMTDNPLHDNQAAIITYLKPNGSSVQLVAKVCYATQQYETVIATGNITDFAMTNKKTENQTSYDIYYTYVKDNKIYCRQVWFLNTSTPLYLYPESEVSSGDGNTSRYTPDISIKNGQPIVTYQAVTPFTRVYAMDEFGGVPAEPHTVNLTMYPIVVRCFNGSTWGNVFTQPSSGTITQSDPNIEGCTTGDSYVLSYRKGNSGYYQYTGLANYHCDPPSFLGTDAKLVRGSYNTPLGSALLTTLTNENPLYRLGKQSFNITNANIQYQDGVYGNIKGVVNMNNTDYIFGMGPIIIQKGPQYEIPLFGDALNEAAPTTGVEFNEYMKSEPFTLHNGDTLIFGTNANYLEGDNKDYYPMKYTIKLMDAGTDEPVTELYSDTIGVEDTEMTEYYRGYVFNDPEMPEGSFYLQTFVEDVSGHGAKYNYVGVYPGDEEAAERGGRIDPTHGIYVDYGRGRNPESNITLKPSSYSLMQNYPNPFNPATTIRYSLPNDGLVQIKVYDISGKEVMSLVNENKTAGNYEVKFNGANLSSGIYFYRINAGEFVQTKRMVLVK